MFFKFEFSLHQINTYIHTTNDEIKREVYTFSLVSDVEESGFF